MQFTSLVFGLLLLGLCATNVASRDHKMLPMVFHNLSWSIAFLIIGTGAISYESISGLSYAVIFVAIMLFNGGYLIAVGSTSIISTSREAPKPLLSIAQFRIILVAFSVGFASYLLTISRLFGLHELIDNPSSIRQAGSQYMEAFPTWAKILFYLGPLLFTLCLFPAYVAGLSGRWWRLPLSAAIAVTQVATLGRTNLFVCIVWVSGMVLLTSRPKSSTRRQTQPKYLAIAAAAGVALVVFQLLAVALGKTMVDNPTIRDSVSPSLRGSQYTSLLYYASSALPAFDSLMHSTNTAWPPDRPGAPVFGDYNPQTWGAATFAGPLKAMPFVPLHRWEEVAPFTAVPAPTNVYTWLEPWYRDFRIPGVLIGPLFLGFIVGRVIRARDVGPAFRLLAGLLVGFTLLAPFVNRYGSVMSLVLYSTLIGIHLLNRTRSWSGPTASGTMEAGSDRISTSGRHA